MKQIKLTQGKFTLVDDEDHRWLNQWKWHYCDGYASRMQKVGKKYYRFWMHREIQKTPSNKVTDHINGDKLDNCRINLRSVTNSQNLRKQKVRSTSTS